MSRFADFTARLRRCQNGKTIHENTRNNTKQLGSASCRLPDVFVLVCVNSWIVVEF